MGYDKNAPCNANNTVVTSSASAKTVLAENGNRIGFSVWNGADTTLYLLLENKATVATVTAAIYTVQLVAGAYWECPWNYQGRVQGIWAGGPTGNALVNEYTSD